MRQTIFVDKFKNGTQSSLIPSASTPVPIITRSPIMTNQDGHQIPSGELQRIHRGAQQTARAIYQTINSRWSFEVAAFPLPGSEEAYMSEVMNSLKKLMGVE
jgi:hypothetical protein